jgi:hypothetical protein
MHGPVTRGADRRSVRPADLPALPRCGRDIMGGRRGIVLDLGPVLVKALVVDATDEDRVNIPAEIGEDLVAVGTGRVRCEPVQLFVRVRREAVERHPDPSLTLRMMTSALQKLGLPAPPAKAAAAAAPNTAASIARCERVWGSSKAGASRTPIRDSVVT